MEMRLWYNGLYMHKASQQDIQIIIPVEFEEYTRFIIGQF